MGGFELINANVEKTRMSGNTRYKHVWEEYKINLISLW